MAYTFRLVDPEELEPSPELDVNIWGCMMLRKVMIRVGVLDTETPRPEFPKWEIPGVSQSRLIAAEVAISEDWPLETVLSTREAAMLHELERREHEVLRSRSPNPGSVPAYKLGSNDGWHVLPEECAAIVAALEGPAQQLSEGEGPLGEGDLAAVWVRSPDLVKVCRNFVDFCRKAARAGGFRVL